MAANRDATASGEEQAEPRWPAEHLVDELIAPAYAGACISNVVPALMEFPPLGDGWMPRPAADAERVVLCVIDGLGWHQLAERRHLAPVLAEAVGGPISSVAPTTTAAALTSIATGSTPGEHGIVGYRIRVGAETLNSLRWTTAAGDARVRIPPHEMQPMPSFGSRRPVVVNKGDFVGSGFTAAHLDGVDYRRYATTATLVELVAEAARSGERFVYTYYDGLDRVGHEYGHGAMFDAEFAFVDRLVGDLRSVLPDDVALVVTADHGQVHTGDAMTHVDNELLGRCVAMSGEDRFVWLHAPGNEDVARELAVDRHGEHAWVLSVDEVLDRGLLGPIVSEAARRRLGDVAMIAKGTHGFIDPRARNPRLLARHGSLTRAELDVPLLAV